MRYAVARYNENQREMVYRVYVSECLRILTQNTAQNGGQYVSEKVINIIHKKPVDNRTGKEIVADVIKNAGIEVVG